MYGKPVELLTFLIALKLNVYDFVLSSPDMMRSRYCAPCVPVATNFTELRLSNVSVVLFSRYAFEIIVSWLILNRFFPSILTTFSPVTTEIGCG